MTQKKKSIGVFDSGFGGLSILKEIVKKMPEYDYVYLGDTARVPYGARSPELIYQFTVEAIEFLFAHNCDLVIIACNTASAEALRKVQQEYLPIHHAEKKVLGVIVPAIEEAIAKTRNKRVGVIATEATVASGTFVKEITRRDSAVKVYQNAAPLLVPLVEAGEMSSPMTTFALEQYLRPLLRKKIDTLILGCTHYGLLQSHIKKIVGKNVTIISEGPIVARKLRDYLNKHTDIESQLSHNSAWTFYSTDLTERFTRLGSVFFGATFVSKKAIL